MTPDEKTKPKKLKKHQHTVARFHLDGFGRDGMLIQLDTRTGTQVEVSVRDATVHQHFYSVLQADGSRSNAWEDWLGERETDAAPARQRAINATRFQIDATD